jgi:hypothetical protein
MKRHAEEQFSVRYLEYKKLNRHSKLDYFKEMEELIPLSALIRNTPARSMATDMIVFNISRDIVKVIIHQLLLDYDPDDSAEDDNSTTENVKDFFLVNGDNEAEERFETSWSNKLQFAMIVQLGSCFASAPSGCSILKKSRVWGKLAWKSDSGCTIRMCIQL